jgi:hypothetical protein
METAGGQSLAGYVDASYADMVAVFGEPKTVQGGDGKERVRWTLAAGTIMYDYKDPRPVREVTRWCIGAVHTAAVDQVAGVAARAGRLGGISRDQNGLREAVRIATRPDGRAAAIVAAFGPSLVLALTGDEPVPAHAHGITAEDAADAIAAYAGQEGYAERIAGLRDLAVRARSVLGG